MIGVLKKCYQRQAFFPGLLGVFVNPFYFARSGLCRAMSDVSPALGGRLLDVGCGTKPYQSLFSVDEYIGLDIDSDESRARGVADYYYDGKAFPFEDESFDSVLCNQVLEHVFNPDHFICEIFRILKPGGKLLLTVPFVWDEHEQPFDFARYSSFGLKALLTKQNFLLIEHKKTNADISTVFQLLNAYLFKITIRLPKYIKIFFIMTICASVNLVGVLLSRILPGNPDLYLDHVVLAEKIY
ncbi:MAG: class I SAM-dependent methyltransferase [Halopseudomonas sp.]